MKNIEQNDKVDFLGFDFDEIELNYLLEAVQEKRQHVSNWILEPSIRKMALRIYCELEEKILKALE